MKKCLDKYKKKRKYNVIQCIGCSRRRDVFVIIVIQRCTLPDGVFLFDRCAFSSLLGNKSALSNSRQFWSRRFIRHRFGHKLNLNVWAFPEVSISDFGAVSGMELNREDDDANDVVESTHHPPMMTTTSVHHFGDGDYALSITVIENMKEEYGLFVWPCSVILAEYVWQQRSRFSGANVVELGAGTSLPGLVAAKVGADVTLTDDLNRPEVLDNMRRVCDLNNLKCKVLGLTWGVWDAPIFTLCPNIILGADVLYETTAFDDLFASVTFLLQKCPSSVFITAYHNRSGHHLIEFLMVKWGLKCVKLLDGFSFLPADKTSGLRGNIQLVEIILDRQADLTNG